MNAKLPITKTWICLLLACPLMGRAQEAMETSIVPQQVAKDTVIIIKHDTVWLEKEKVEMKEEVKVKIDSADVDQRFSRYDRRVHRYRKHWEALIPTHTKLQFAGNMGLISLGTGWDYGKRNQWETDLFFGFLPKYQSERSKITMTLKQNYMPWSVTLGKGISVEPLACGMYLNTVFGNEFWTHEPDRYPKGYYGFSSKVRIHIFLGQRITYDIPPRWRLGARAVTFFYEISTCDLYVVSAFLNKYLKPKDYLSLSFGLKTQLF